MATSSSSSAKKVAKLAQRGKGKKVRFQGGSLFPVAVLVVIVVGLLTIVYARQSRPDAGSQPPQVNDHWHAAYGVYVCDTWLPKLSGALEDTQTDPSTGRPIPTKFSTTGVHSHGDGVIHWHPYSTKAVGNRAKLGLFLDNYGVELSTTELKMPAGQGGNDYKVSDFTCNGKKAQITVPTWDSYTDTGKGTTNITSLSDVRLKNDGMVFTIAIVPAGTPVTMPPWAKNLPDLGAADGSGTTTTVAGDTSGTTGATTTGDTATGNTATGDTTTGDTATGTTDTAAPGTTAGG